MVWVLVFVIGVSKLKIVAKNNFQIHHIEGRKDNQWILVDAKDIIIHIFTKEGRRNYNLDKLWSDLPQLDYKDFE